MALETQFDIVIKNRARLHHYLETTPKEELVKIPKGFNNNIWWNIAHVMVTEQKLIYGLSGLPLGVSEEMIAKYGKGSFPQENPSDTEMALIKTLLLALPEKTRSDYNNGVFADFKSYMTTTKVELNAVEDAIAFNAFHEGLHLGSIMALARVLKA